MNCIRVRDNSKNNWLTISLISSDLSTDTYRSATSINIDNLTIMKICINNSIQSESKSDGSQCLWS